MNREKVQQIINRIIEENRTRIGAKAARKQYKPGKAQMEKLTALGIIDLMPAGYGFSDADAVINAANEKATAVFNAAGEGEAIAASDLYLALNEVEEKVEYAKVTRNQIAYMLSSYIVMETLVENVDGTWSAFWANDFDINRFGFADNRIAQLVIISQEKREIRSFDGVNFRGEPAIYKVSGIQATFAFNLHFNSMIAWMRKNVKADYMPE